MPITTCDSSQTLRAEIETVRKKVSLDETEETWDTIAQGIQHLTRLCNIGGCDFPPEMVAGIRSMSRPLNNALNSERSRLSGAAVELVTALAIALGSAFDPLVTHFVPTLLALCGRTNKVFTSRARACVLVIVQHTRLPTLLPHLAELANHKSAFPRLTAAESILACLNCCNPPDLERETRVRVVEDFIRLTARDASADVRKACKEVFKAYKTLMPARVDSFVAPLTPVVKKYLDIQTGRPGVHGISSHARQKQISKPASRVNNKATEPVHRPASALSEPPTRPATDGPSHSARQQLAAHVAPTRGPRQRTTSQMRHDEPRNLHIIAQSSNTAQRCVIPTSAPVRPAIQRPPPGAAQVLPVAPTRGPQRPPPVQMKLNPPPNGLKVTGSGAKRIPLPPVPVHGHAGGRVAAAADSGGQTSSTVDKPPSKFPNRSARAVAPGKLVVSRKVPEGTRSASSSSKPPNRSALVGSTVASRSHQRPVKGETNSSNGTAPQRRPAGNAQKSTHPPVKAERKAMSPTLIPLPPSPSISPTEMPLPPSPDGTPRPADPEVQDQPVVVALSGPSEPAEEQLRTAELCQELGDMGNPSTPISTLLSSIQRGFLFTPSTPLSPPQNYLLACGDLRGDLREKLDAMIVSDASKGPSTDVPFCTSVEDGSNRHALRDLN